LLGCRVCGACEARPTNPAKFLWWTTRVSDSKCCDACVVGITVFWILGLIGVNEKGRIGREISGARPIPPPFYSYSHFCQDMKRVWGLAPNPFHVLTKVTESISETFFFFRETSEVDLRLGIYRNHLSQLRIMPGFDIPFGEGPGAGSRDRIFVRIGYENPIFGTSHAFFKKACRNGNGRCQESPRRLGSKPSEVY